MGKKNGIKLNYTDGRESEFFPVKCEMITNDPKECITGSQLILLPLPSFAHRPILAQCRDYLEKNAMIGAFPGKNGFQWVAKEVLGEKFNDVIVFGTDRLPHACRTNVFGEEATLFGIKKV